MTTGCPRRSSTRCNTTTIRASRSTPCRRRRTAQYAGQPNGLTNAQAVAYSDTSSRPGAIFYPGTVPYGTGNYGGTWRQGTVVSDDVRRGVVHQGGSGASAVIGGLTPSQAAGFYNAGITASMNQWGVTDAADIAAYLAQPQVAYRPERRASSRSRFRSGSRSTPTAARRGSSGAAPARRLSSRRRSRSSATSRAG